MITYNKKDIPEHLQKYFEPAELGLEKTPEEYVSKLVEVFREVKRVLKDDGTCWLNLGDSYNTSPVGHKSVESLLKSSTAKVGNLHEGNLLASKKRRVIKDGILKPKDLVGIPWRVAFALQADGWYLRQDIIWHKPNPMPESVTDRCTKSHEYIFLLTKNSKYYYDNEAIKEKATTLEKERLRPNGSPTYQKYGHDTGCGVSETRNKRSVWTVTTKPFKEAHFATFPEDLITPMIKAGCPKDGLVMDIFSGAGTTCKVAKDFGRNYIGIELNPEYLKIAADRLRQEVLF